MTLFELNDETISEAAKLSVSYKSPKKYKESLVTPAD
jgi:hypothetical protein